MPTVTPFLWFDNNLDEAIAFYAKVFPDIKSIEVAKGPDGKAFTATFELAGQKFTGLNGGPLYKFNEAVSFAITCKDQKEVDYYYDAFLDGGKEYSCGWIGDKFGLVWQVTPKGLMELLTTGTEAQKSRAQGVMEGQKKLIIADIEKAWQEAV